MAIYKGNKEIVGLYKGPTEIIKRYKGSNLIYNAFKWLPYSYEHIYNSLVPQYMNKSGVPEEYQEVEYIESTGTQYIDTGVYGNLNTKVILSYKLTQLVHSAARVFGDRYTNDEKACVLGISGSFNYYAQFDSSSRTQLKTLAQDLTKHTHELSKNGYYVDNELVSSIDNPQNFNTDRTLLIGGFKQQETYLGTGVAVYSCKIYDNNTLVRDFIPCYRKSDNVIGLYDKVNNTFYTNAGTGTFLKGADVKRTVKDKAHLNTIYGNSIVENQLCIIPTISSQTTNGVTLTNNGDGSITLSGTATATFDFTLMGNLNRDIPFGHKVLITNFKTPNISTYYLYDAYESNLASLPNTPGAYIKDKEGSSTIISPRIRIENGATINETIFIMYIDLTQWFPFNTPTTLADTRVQSIINRGHIPYNTGTLKNVDIGEISSEPYNLFDGELEDGWINNSGQIQFQANGPKSSTNLIPVVGGKEYTLTVDKPFNQKYIVEYDKNGVFIKKRSLSPSITSLTLSNNTYFARIQFTTEPYDETAKACFHLTGTRTGYAPHTQSYTLPFKYQGSGVGTSHDTLEIADTEYVFTKNIVDADLGALNYLVHNSRVFYSYSGFPTPYNNTPNSLSTAYQVWDGPQDSMPNKSITMRGGAGGSIWIRDDNFTYDSTGAGQLKASLANKTIKYQLATPQVVRIPKKHLAVVDLGTLNWERQQAYGVYEFFSKNIMNLIEPRTSNLLCSLYSVGNRAGLQNKEMAIDSHGLLVIRDDDYTDVETFKTAMSGVYLFYETESEVEDIPSIVDIEAGGTLTSNLFSWVENQQTDFTVDFVTKSVNGITIETDLTKKTIRYYGTASANATCGFISSSNDKNNLTVGHKYLLKLNKIGNSGNSKCSVVGLNSSWLDIQDNIYTGIATSQYGQVIIYSGEQVDFTIQYQIIDLTQGFGAGKEPTSINDPRIQYIIKQGYIPTNITGTNKSIASEVLPNIDFKIKCK